MKKYCGKIMHWKFNLFQQMYLYRKRSDRYRSPLIAMGLFGLAMPIFNTPAMTIIQEKVDPNYLGRVFGVFGMISTSMMPLGMLVFGPLADMVAVEQLLIWTGGAMLIVTVCIKFSKALIEAGKPNNITE